MDDGLVWSGLPACLGSRWEGSIRRVDHIGYYFSSTYVHTLRATGYVVADIRQVRNHPPQGSKSLFGLGEALKVPA